MFQFNASSSRSDIGRRRASMTASGTASGSRTATGSVALLGRGCSADDPTVGSVPGTHDRTAAGRRRSCATRRVAGFTMLGPHRILERDGRVVVSVSEAIETTAADLAPALATGWPEVARSPRGQQG